MDREATISKLEAESAAYMLMGSILRDMPEQEWLASLAQEDLFAAVPFGESNASVEAGAATLQAWAQAYSDDQFDDVYNDCMVLLVGPGKPEAAPWESVYSEKNEGLIFQEETLEVRKAYRAFGLQVDKLHHEPDDHVAYELEFVATLDSLAAAAFAENRDEDAASFIAAKDSFLKTHIATWVPIWCNLMDEHAKTPFYKGIALLVRGFVETSLEEIA